MQSPDVVDVVVIGGGPAGTAAAIKLAAAGRTVTLLEKSRVGGTCLHRGCIPAKHMLETAAVARTVTSAAEFGVLAGVPVIDVVRSQERKRTVVERLHRGLAHSLRSVGVNHVQGTGRLSGPDLVEMVHEEGSTMLRASLGVILATGSSARELPAFPIDGERVLNSDHVLGLDDLPGTAIVIGGGAIGCEFASLLTDLGCGVTLVEVAPEILPGCDGDVSAVVRRSFRRRGMEVRVGTLPGGLVVADGGVSVEIGEEESLAAEMLVVAAGRVPSSDHLGLAFAAVETDDSNFIRVDERYRTSNPKVWAIGDLIATPQLAHVAHAEGLVAAGDLLGEDPEPIAYGQIPCCIYSHPEVAFVGMDERTAREAYGDGVVVSKRRFVSNGRASIIGDTEGLVKIVAAPVSGDGGVQVVGVHMAGPWVTEQLGQGTLAVRSLMDISELAQVVQPHPSLSELFGEGLEEARSNVVTSASIDSLEFS